MTDAERTFRRRVWSVANAAFPLAHALVAALVFALQPSDPELLSVVVGVYAFLMVVTVFWPLAWLGALVTTWGAPGEGTLAEALHSAALALLPALLVAVAAWFALDHDAWAALQAQPLGSVGPGSTLGSCWLLTTALVLAVRLRAPATQA